MLDKGNIASLVEEHKRLFIIIAVVLFLIEIEIFALAAMKSGRKSHLQVFDAGGNLIHETDGQQLSDFNKYYFEKTFGPFEQYEVKLITQEVPFPFRAWFAAAVGIPVGVVLLFGFIVRAYTSLFYGTGSTATTAGVDLPEDATGFEKIIARAGRFNIFTIGLLVFLAIFGYWVIPNMITTIGLVGIETLTRFKWLFLGLGVVVLGLFVWIVYLRYLLAKRALDAKTDLDRFRLQLDYDQKHSPAPQLEYDGKRQSAAPAAAWDSEGPEANRQE